MYADSTDARHGFTSALFIPAAVSTLKQCEREIAPELHHLADWHAANLRSPGCEILTHRDAEVLRRLGTVVVQQIFNGATFLGAAQMAVREWGTKGGMVAQMAITLNTMFNPRQTQRFNPARLLSHFVSADFDWTRWLGASQQLAFARAIGAAAVRMGYGRGTPSATMPAGAITA